MKYTMTPVSTNRKVGPIPVTYSSAATCPDACPLKKSGCYAEYGPGAAHWRRVTAGARGDDWGAFLDKVRAIPRRQLWRHNVAGDLPGEGDTLDTSMLAELVRANAGKRGFTYTHKPVLTEPANAEAIRLANASGFTINLSADSMAEADALKALGVGPVVTLLPRSAPTKSVTPGGNVVIACPAETNDRVTCSSCGVCAVADRRSIIGFRAHGSGAKKVEGVISIS